MPPTVEKTASKSCKVVRGTQIHLGISQRMIISYESEAKPMHMQGQHTNLWHLDELVFSFQHKSGVHADGKT